MGKGSVVHRSRGALLAMPCAVVLCAVSLWGCASQAGLGVEGDSGNAAQDASLVAAEGDRFAEVADMSADGSDAMEGEAAMAIAIRVSVNGKTMIAQLEDSASSREFVQLLEEGPLTVEMRDYAGMEKVGILPRGLVRSDRPTDVGPGDIVLYQGNQITIYYETNSWNFTRLGRIQDAGADELRGILGAGDAEVTFSLEG